MLIDSHAHYDDRAFAADRDAVLSSLPAAGIAALINAGSDIPSSEKSLALSARYAFVYATVGVHPHESARAPADYLDKIESLSKNPKAVAIGEIGLDYHYNFSPRDIQKQVFDAQLSLAEKLNLPVVIHEREAIADTLDILRAHPKASGVMHCFSGSLEVAKILLNRGFYISFGGVLTFKNAVNAPKVALYTPPDRILLETDCPYLTPVPHRGKRNDSRFLPLIAQKLAQIRGISPQEVADITTSNACTLFNIKL